MKSVKKIVSGGSVSQASPLTPLRGEGNCGQRSQASGLPDSASGLTDSASGLPDSASGLPDSASGLPSPRRGAGGEAVEAVDYEGIPYRDIVDGPYAIGENDHSYLFINDDTFEAAKALEIGKIGTYVVPMKSTQDGEETVTGYNGYLFRRAEGTMCEEGETGTIKIDYYPGIRDSAENGLRQKRWMSDAVYTDAMYAYRGSF